MEQLPVNMKVGSYVCKCENYGVFVFLVCVVCRFVLKNTIKIGV